MKKGWELVIHEPSMRVALAARSRERAALFQLFDRLVANPYTKGHFTEEDESGRPMEVLLDKSWAVTFWLDAYVNEIRIVRIEKTSSQ